MKVLLAVVVSLAALFTPQRAYAQFRTGNDLYQMCTTSASSDGHFQDTAFCIGYIVGAADSIKFYQTAPGVEKFVCVPESATAGQLKDVVVKYLQNHPEDRHRSGNGIVLLALATAFLCKK